MSCILVPRQLAIAEWGTILKSMAPPKQILRSMFYPKGEEYLNSNSRPPEILQLYKIYQAIIVNLLDCCKCLSCIQNCTGIKHHVLKSISKVK